MFKRKAGSVVGTNVVEGPYWRRGHRRTLMDYKLTKKKKSKKEKGTFRRNLIQELVGYAPYEVRIMEQYEIREKKVKRFCKRRLGSMKRMKKKFEKLKVIARKLKKIEEEEKKKLEGEVEEVEMKDSK